MVMTVRLIFSPGASIKGLYSTSTRQEWLTPEAIRVRRRTIRTFKVVSRICRRCGSALILVLYQPLHSGLFEAGPVFINEELVATCR